jgi:uncharacterized protein YjbI with pentapeptide repeats
MRPRTLTALAAVGLAVAAPVALAGQQSTTIGTGAKTCVLGPGADCRGVVHRWTVEHHGNLRKAKFTKADLRGADFRGADLRGADFRGAKLRHADLRGANLKGARLDVVKRAGKGANGAPGPSCYPNCQRADLSNANLTGTWLTAANLTNAILSNANLTGADLTNANLTSANLSDAMLYFADLPSANLTNADLSYAILLGADLTNANLTGTTWNNTTCPDGPVTNTGC